MGSSSCAVVCEEGVQPLYKSSSNIHTSVSMHSGSYSVCNELPAQPANFPSDNETANPPLTRTARSASRQSMRTCSSTAINDLYNHENPQSFRMSSVSLKAPSISSLRTAQSTSRQRIPSSASDVAYDERPTMLCASEASLHSSNTKLPRSSPFTSQQRLLADGPLVEASSAALHASTPMLTTALPISQEDLDGDLPVSTSPTSEVIIPANESLGNPPLRISMV
ncbi:unnamed protein product [Cylicostephanus goldi]|uniref:Uncharacterized protein n=1 Tax=Cylicostephanus goldi TaxID=71465 RepID=A0A3P6QF85_CYLGO|nr:unnamed protein product [Cylicostephanus goldi]